jgi:hypothetical protein
MTLGAGVDKAVLWRTVRLAALPALVALNAVLTVTWFHTMALGAPAVDWDNYVEASRRFFDGGLYEYRVGANPLDDYAWHYSPVLAPLFGVLGPMGEAGWRYLHVLALPLLPRRLMAIVLVSWPFWVDVESGNVMTFVLIAAVWALRGNRVGIFATLALTLLVPRPLMLPLAGWLLWKHPEWRVPFAAMFAVHAVAVAATGWGPAWVGDLLAASRDVALPWNLAPTQWLGMAWMLVAVPLAVWSFWRGRPALSGLLLQPYWLPYYLLLPLADRYSKAAR